MSDMYLSENENGVNLSMKDLATRNSVTFVTSVSKGLQNDSFGNSKDTGIEIAVVVRFQLHLFTLKLIFFINRNSKI